MAISKNWLSMVGKKFRRSSDSTDTILPSSIAVSSRFSSQKTDTPKEDNAEVNIEVYIFYGAAVLISIDILLH